MLEVALNAQVKSSPGRRRPRNRNRHPPTPWPRGVTTHIHTQSLIDFAAPDHEGLKIVQTLPDLLSMSHPSVDGDVWQRRLDKRQHAVHSIKKKPEYMSWLANKDSVRPLTPDPQDAKVSKRQWERSVQQWRRALQERNHDQSQVTVQTLSTLAWLGGPEQELDLRICDAH